MTRTLIAAAVCLALSSPAFAFQCPTDMAAIDAALAENPDLSSEEMAKVKELRAKGDELHRAGDHQESIETLAEAKEILGIE
jgi:hypothetical protein